MNENTEDIVLTENEAKLIYGSISLNHLVVSGTRKLNPESPLYDDAVQFIKWFREEGGSDLVDKATSTD